MKTCLLMLRSGNRATAARSVFEADPVHEMAQAQAISVYIKWNLCGILRLMNLVKIFLKFLYGAMRSGAEAYRHARCGHRFDCLCTLFCRRLSLSVLRCERTLRSHI